MKPIENTNVVMLNNYITPHHKPIYEALSKRVGHLTMLLSTPMESNRNWQPDWGDLDVRVQKNFTYTRHAKHSHGFKDANYIHIPYDTLSQIRALKPDVLVSYEMGFRTLFSSWSRWTHRIPMVMVVNVSRHTENKVIRSRRILRSLVKRFADVITYNGPSCKSYLQEEMKVPEERLFHVPYATDPGKHYTGQLLRGPEKAYHLLYSGQLSERKGVLPFSTTLVRWAEDNPHRQVKFSVAGDGPLRSEMESLELPENMEMVLHGHCGPDQLLQLYRDSGLYTFPTLADEWGMVSEEAWMAGLPVLGSEFAQSVEALCQEGENGWMFQPTDEQQMYQKIDQAMNTPIDRLNEMRQLCRDSVMHRTPDYAADKFVEAIEASMRFRNR